MSHHRMSTAHTDDASEIRRRRAILDNLRPGDSLNGRQVTAVDHTSEKTIISFLSRVASHGYEVHVYDRSNGQKDVQHCYTGSQEAAEKHNTLVRLHRDEDTDHHRTRAAEKEMERAAARSELGMPPSSSPRRRGRGRL